MASGKPKLSLSYHGSNQNFLETVHEATHFEDKNAYFDGKVEVVMRLPTSGIICCEVRDLLGDYTAYKEIVRRGRSYKPGTTTCIGLCW